MGRDRRVKRDLHALDQNDMVLCNPRDKEADHRAQVEGIVQKQIWSCTSRQIDLMGKLEGKHNRQ